MIKANTLFILGAAASPQFPLGGQLQRDVANLLQFSGANFREDQRRLWMAANAEAITPRRLAEIGRQVNDGINLSPSIDNYLQVRSGERDLVTCCKLGVAEIILANEVRARYLRSDIVRDRSPSDFSLTWYEIFAHVCFQGCTSKADVPQALARFSVISFNYDRCYEQFVRIAVSRLFSVSYEEATALTANLRVIHPYGSLGLLPEEQAGATVGFGQEQNVDIQAIAKNIRTFTEAQAEHVVTRVREATSKADQIVFIGFGYHQQNLDLLQPSRVNSVRTVLGTCNGLSAYAQKEVSSRLAYLFRSWNGDHPRDAAQVNLEDKQCREFFEHFRLALVE